MLFFFTGQLREKEADGGGGQERVHEEEMLVPVL